MKKVAMMSVIILFVTLLLTVMAAWSVESNPCVSNIDGKVACPPQGGTCLKDMGGRIACSSAFGGIVKTNDGRMLCGPGKCMITAFGEVFCSAEQGGSVTMSVSGPVCTGGCVTGSASACTWP